MKELSSIPSSKIQRTSKFLKTGAKVGGNYIKHYSKRMFDSTVSRDELDEDNAEDIYESLSELKGSALKVAQMLSMDKNLLPNAYQDKFAMAQYNAPPLSYPLIVKTFIKYFGKTPEQIYDTFSRKAVNAASIGQVHQATLGDKKLAVKIQYPGVSDSITSDLKMVKPIASAMFKITAAEMDQYMGEVESKLVEETDYSLELERSIEITELCSHLENITFPKYHRDLSCERILVMDWMEGMHLKDWIATSPSQEARNKLGQALWNFYDYQIYELKQVHADPHPGNFIISPKGELSVIDFGCVKVIPNDFHELYFKLMRSDALEDGETIETLFYKLGFLYEDDTNKEKAFFSKIFIELIELLGRPFQHETFNFGDDSYFSQIYEVGDKIAKMKEFRNSRNIRGNKHGLYVNRTYFGLYNLLNELNANIVTGKKYLMPA
jgi:predicted unusual protein kinase regulating ubiquinone biosynthesis (AarF/ABC1/UbiB family)